MVPVLKVLSLLLSYPTPETRGLMAEARELVTDERSLSTADRRRLVALMDELESGDLIDLQERYVGLFDRSRSLSLHLFEHIHGESRDRGQAMIDLADLYAEHGLAVSARELPDYLPLFLEFLSLLAPDEARSLLGEPLHIITALGQRLDRRDSLYAGTFKALEAIAARTPDRADVAAVLALADDDPDDQAALDRAWEDQPVTFGGGVAGGVSPGGDCPASREALARMDRPGPAAAVKEGIDG